MLYRKTWTKALKKVWVFWRNLQTNAEFLG